MYTLITLYFLTFPFRRHLFSILFIYEVLFKKNYSLNIINKINFLLIARTFIANNIVFKIRSRQTNFGLSEPIIAMCSMCNHLGHQIDVSLGRGAFSPIVTLLLHQNAYHISFILLIYITLHLFYNLMYIIFELHYVIYFIVNPCALSKRLQLFFHCQNTFTHNCVIHLYFYVLLNIICSSKKNLCINPSITTMSSFTN